MTPSRLARVRAMGRDEITFRARVAARTQLDRVAALTRRPRWARADLSRVLAAYVLEAPLSEAIGRGDWDDVHRRLTTVLRGRPSRFVFDAGARDEIRDAVLRHWPDAARQAGARADRILGGEYDLLGYRGLRFTRESGGIDWHLDPVTGRRAPRTFWADVRYLDPAIGDHKVIWELNRHQHWLALGRALWLTGDRRYRREILAQLQSWLADNPPLIGVNWASMLELGFRSLSWLSALHLLLGDADEGSGTGNRDDADGAWTVDLLLALHRQLEHVARNLSRYFSPNTHLLGEALALYVVGQSLPELARSPRWTDLGRRILLEQIDRQIEPDGGHAERSLHYHRYAHDFYLLALLTAERGGDEEAAAAFREAAGRMATFLREMAGDDGRIPLIGDDDGGMLWPMTGRDSADVRDSLALAAAVLGRPDLAPWGACEEALWLAWTGHRNGLPNAGHHGAAAGGSRVTVFPSSGYVVARDGDGGRFILDAGPHGFLNGGHAHADALSMTVAVDRRPLLIDPGTGCYTADPSLRDRLRRTANHNTVTIGGQSSSIPSGPFHWHSRTDARLAHAAANAGFAWVEAEHDGYAGFRHRRSIVQAEGGWLVVDEVLGARGIDAHVHWHFDPQWSVARELDQALLARHDDGASAWLVHDARAMSLAYGDERSGLGWCSPRYGVVVPTWSVRLTSSVNHDARTAVTWIGAARHGEAAPSIERLSSEALDGEAVIAVRVRRPHATSWTAVRPGTLSPVINRRCVAAGYQTDARLLRYTIGADGRFGSLAIGDGTRAVALDEALVSLSADVVIPDLSLRIDDGCLDLRASAPPPLLRLRGRALDRVVALRLNGRGTARAARAGDRELTLSGDDWPEAAVPAGVDLCVA